jgi:hypothetical protein
MLSQASSQPLEPRNRRVEPDERMGNFAHARTKSTPLVSILGPVTATSRVNGLWLEFLVHLPLEATISEVAQFTRNIGYEVWRRPGENKLRCSKRPDTASPMMHVSVQFSNAGEKKGSRVRLRRSRTDHYLTEWWRYVNLQRDLMTHFDKIMTQPQA